MCALLRCCSVVETGSHLPSRTPTPGKMDDELAIFDAYCYYHKDRDLCKRDAKGKKQSHRVLNICDDQHHWLQNGLNAMGARGWELVAVHIESTRSGASFFEPPHWYIFKKQAP